MEWSGFAERSAIGRLKFCEKDAAGAARFAEKSHAFNGFYTYLLFENSHGYFQR